MKQNNNYSFKPVRINKRKSFQDKNNLINNLNMEYQTTDPSSSNFQDFFQKQKKLNDDLATLSTNNNLNFEQNENTISNITPNKKSFNQILTSSHQSKNKIDFNQNPQGPQKLDNNLNSIQEGDQRNKLDELINKFNNLYSSESEIRNDDNYRTLRTLDENRLNINNLNNISSDKINSRHLYKKLSNNTDKNTSKDIINKSSDDLNYINKKFKNRPRTILINNHVRKHNTDLIPNKYPNYSSNRNKIMNKVRTSNSSLNKIRPNSNSQISKDIFKAIREKKIMNDYYSNSNIDNDNNSSLSTMSLKANMVINEFKKTLLEAEKIESELNKSKYSINTYALGNASNELFNINNNLNLTNTDINNIQTQNSFYNPNTINTNNTNTINTKNNSNSMNKNNININNNINNNLNTNLINEDEFLEEEDEFEKIKLQNQLLKKTNSVLKNQNKILSYEINSYKNSSVYKNPFSQYDKELNSFIQDLKTSLDNATQANHSLENMYAQSEKENNSLKEKNKQLLSNLNSIKKECEKIVKENSEIKFELENKIGELNAKDENIEQMQKEISELNNIINNNKNKITYLNNIQESNKLSQKDNEDLILQLKDTIENLQKINLQNNNEIIELKNKLDSSKDLLNTKNDTIANINDDLQKKDLIIQNKETQINELNLIIKEINNKNIKNKNEIQEIQIDKEKLKNEIKTLKMLLADRERTISELKNSIQFLTKTFNKNINMINNNINTALINEENSALDINQSLKQLVGKMQDEINELNKRNNESKKEKKKLEIEINEYNEQYEQLKNEYQLLYQKFIEQNRNIELMKNEFLKQNKNKEIQKLTKANIDLLAKYKKAENDNIIKAQQLAQYRKNYKILNNQLMEFTTKNYNTNLNSNNSFDMESNNNISENQELNMNEYDMNDINRNNDIIPKINNDIKLMESLNMDENNLLQYSSNDNNDLNNLNNLYKKYPELNNNIINNSVSQNDKDINTNLLTEENLMNSMNTDKYKLTTEESDKRNISEGLKNKITITDKEKLTPVQEKINLSTQINLNKLNLKLFNNNNNNSYNLDSNDFRSKTFPSSLINNKYNNEINEDSLEEKNIITENNIVSQQNIYTLKGNLLIYFNFNEKKFKIANPIDKTNGLYENYLSKGSYIPLTLNTYFGFFILLNDFIFFYDEEKNTINLLNKLISSHINGGCIFINQELYSISGVDNLSCEKYSIKNRKNIILPCVNYPRINAGLCNYNNKYLYVYFGEKCINSIERLNLSIDYESMKEYVNSWECIKIYSLIENGKQIGLQKFTSYLDDYNNIIILGGSNDKGELNQDIFGLNLENNEINAIGKIDTCALYLGQNTQLNDSIFAIYDAKNGIHFFNKDLDYHEIYNFNL